MTTARFTNALNCSLSVGDIVDSASRVCTTPSTSMPVIGAPAEFTLAKSMGNIRSSAADLPVCAIVNCQPSSDPRQASTARPMTTVPTNGLNIFSYTNPNGPVDSASSAFGTMPWITVVEST